MAEFAYNNKIHATTKTLPFKVNYSQDPRMGFEGRRKGKYEVAGKFVEKMKKIQEEAKAALGKAQEEMKKFADRKQGKGEEYRVGDLVLLSMKDLKWQMKGRRLEKLTEHFVGPYKVKGIVSSNAIELELPKSIKIHPVVNVMLSLSLDDSRTTRCECLGRTRWSSPLDWTTYLYYFYKWLYTTSPQSYVLLECSTIT